MSASSGLMSSWQKIQRIYTKTQRLPVTTNAESSAVISDIWRPIVLNLEGKKPHVSTNKLLSCNCQDSTK